MVLKERKDKKGKGYGFKRKKGQERVRKEDVRLEKKEKEMVVNKMKG